MDAKTGIKEDFVKGRKDMLEDKKKNNGDKSGGNVYMPPQAR